MILKAIKLNRNSWADVCDFIAQYRSEVESWYGFSMWYVAHVANRQTFAEIGDYICVGEHGELFVIPCRKENKMANNNSSYIYICPNCGSVESYEDPDAIKVCTSCGYSTVSTVCFEE